MRTISIHQVQFLLAARNRNICAAVLCSMVSLFKLDRFLLFAGAFDLAGVRDGRDALLALYLITDMHWLIV